MLHLSCRRFRSLPWAIILVAMSLASGPSSGSTAMVMRQAWMETGKEDVDAAIRTATGLRFRVLESVIRRNITSTRTPYGFKVRSVDGDSPASRAGLKKGDVLLEWDGRPIKSRADLKKWLDEAERGVEIPIKYARLKEKRRALDRHPWVEHEGTITLDQQPAEP